MTKAGKSKQINAYKICIISDSTQHEDIPFCEGQLTQRIVVRFDFLQSSGGEDTDTSTMSQREIFISFRGQ